MLRVIGGAAAIDVYVSKWLILTTLFASLFIAVMKRNSELALDNDGEITRYVLSEYSNELINLIISVSASGLVICYALYTVAERTVGNFGTENLVFTTIFVIYGVFRYMYLASKKGKGENAVDAVLSDLPMLINVILYFSSVVFIIYVVG